MEAILLAGGMSRRMGSSKARLCVHGQTVAEYQLQKLLPHVERVLFVTNGQDYAFFQSRFSDQNVVVMLDDERYRGQGPLAGLFTAMKRGTSDWFVVLACDMVNIESSMVAGLISFVYHDQKKNGSEYAAYLCHHQRLHPLFGVYRRDHVRFETFLRQGTRKVQTYLDQTPYYSIDEARWRSWTKQDQPFYNMNDSKEYEQWLKNQS